MKTLLLLAAGLFISLSGQGETLKPVKWSFTVTKTSEIEANILIKASINDGWHVYAQAIPEGGPLKATFSFIPARSYQLLGSVAEPKPIIRFEEFFNMNVSYFEEEVVFKQKIKLTGKGTIVKGAVKFMACSAKQCLPPEKVEFSVPVK